MDLSALWQMSYGVYIASTLDGDRPVGCIANSIMQVTNEPNAVVVSVNRANYTNQCIKKTGMIGIAIVAEETPASIIGTFGFSSSADKNKFEGIEYFSEQGMPIISQCCSYMICKVTNTMELSTHTLFVAEIIDCAPVKKLKAMTYEYYHKVVKGKSPKNAPTYIPETVDMPREVYVCSICHYEYGDQQGPFEKLGNEYACPVCTVGKEFFELKTLTQKAKKKGWVCSVCKYEYSDPSKPFEETDADYKCPICQEGKGKFEFVEPQVETHELGWECSVCHFKYDNKDVTFEAASDNYKCPLCSAGKEYFEFK